MAHRARFQPEGKGNDQVGDLAKTGGDLGKGFRAEVTAFERRK